MVFIHAEETKSSRKGEILYQALCRFGDDSNKFNAAEGLGYKQKGVRSERRSRGDLLPVFCGHSAE